MLEYIFEDITMVIRTLRVWRNTPQEALIAASVGPLSFRLDKEGVELIDTTQVDSIRLKPHGTLAEQLAAMTDEYTITEPADCKGLRETHASATYESAGVRLDIEGPLRVVVAVIRAAQ